MAKADLAARHADYAGANPQKANTEAKNIRKEMEKGGSHPTHRCLDKYQSVARMRSAYGKVAIVKFPIAATGWAYALRLRMASPS